MRKVYLTQIFIFIIINCFELSSQNYSKGFILTSPDDSIHGYILDGIDSDLTYNVSFKVSLPEDSINNYNPTDIYGFGFSYGRTFYSQQINIEEDVDYVFAKKLLSGKIDLSVVRQKDLMIAKNQSSKEEVLFIKPSKEIKERADGSDYVYKNSDHIGLLSIIKQDDNYNKVESDHFNYSESKIIKSIKNYNMLFKDEYRTSSYKPRKRIFYDIIVGIPFIKAHEQSYAGAIYTNITSIEKTNRISLRMGLAYYFNNYEKPESFPNYTTTEQTTKQNTLLITPLCFHLQTKPRFLRPYMYLGAGIYVNKETIESFKMISPEDVIKTTTDIEYGAFLDFGLGLKIKTGKNYSMLEIRPLNNNNLIVFLGFSFGY